MPAQAITKECVEKALDELKREAGPAQESRNTLFEYLPVSDVMDDVDDVKRQWFDVSNLL